MLAFTHILLWWNVVMAMRGYEKIGAFHPPAAVCFVCVGWLVCALPPSAVVVVCLFVIGRAAAAALLFCLFV